MTREPVSQVGVPGHPFSAIPTVDGCAVLVSLPSEVQSHIAVLENGNGLLALTQNLPVDGMITGMTLSPDGRFIAAATGGGVAIFDVSKLIKNQSGSRIASLNEEVRAGSVYTAFSSDQHFLFVANERSASISIFDTSNLPAMPKRIGKIPVGVSPVGLALSTDGKYLYSTSEVGPSQWPKTCTKEGPPHPQGVLLVIELAKAASDPAHSVLTGVSAGCDAVRVVTSPDGATLYVTARGDNTIGVFNATKLLSDSAHARLAVQAVGASPVGVAVAKGKVFVANSNRFDASDDQSISVLDVAALSRMQVNIPAGGFPRELRITTDGNTLLVTNFSSNTLELVDLQRLNAAIK